MKVNPLYDRVLVKRVDPDETVKGGIIIPDTAKEKPMEGEVLSIGLGKRDKEGNRIPMDVKEGDRILFSKYAGNEFELGGIEHLILKEDEILGVLQK